MASSTRFAASRLSSAIWLQISNRSSTASGVNRYSLILGAFQPAKLVSSLPDAHGHCWNRLILLVVQRHTLLLSWPGFPSPARPATPPAHATAKRPAQQSHLHSCKLRAPRPA